MDGEAVAAAVLVLLGTIAVVVPLLVSSKRRRVVTEKSAALADLCRLNDSFHHRLSYHPPITYHWEDRVNSKAKLDRYDLKTFFFERLTVLDDHIQRQITAQIKDVSVYAEYADSYQQLGSLRLGRSASDVLRPETFARIEQKFFAKRRLRQPACSAQVRCTVYYTSPQGQNSYAKWQDWNFEQLQNGLTEMRRIRETRSTAKFLRQQERNRMNASLRYQVLARDNSRCRRCGATPGTQGVTLHVDHIIPVSKGGSSELANLQTLCETCNLGKSNRH